MRRRDFLTHTGLMLAASGAAGAATQVPTGPVNGAPTAPPDPACHPSMPLIATADGLVPLPLVRAQTDRIIALTVCTRPFRAGGARIETERLGRKTIVHNYGHGGSGWSLSWGSGTLAVRKVLETRASEIAVIGCGVIGLTSALLAQRAGLKVRIYAKDRPPDTRSTFATGNWSPNSRYCSVEGMTPEVAAQWEEMARISFRMYQNLLGLPGDPIEWRDGYFLVDSGTQLPHAQQEPEYPALESRISDILPRGQEMPPGTHPFPVDFVRRFTNMIFNISAYSRLLVADFLAAGGVIETREFEKPGDIARLREKTVINATGYGARALFGDESITPVRGQLMRLIPQPEVTYGLNYGDQFYMVPRRDGIILQSQAPGDFGNADITPDRAAAERTVRAVADLNQRIRANLTCVQAAALP
ncbi:MAG TPA: FAD-dependent oxidoreductase [Steroidobacteraceae bacterium]